MVKWNNILQRREYSLEKPDEIVVNLASVLEKRKAKRVLDLGCGAGRHVIYLADRGFEAHGADISEIGLKLTRKRLRNRKLKAEIMRCDMKLMPYVDSCFDAVICVNTVYHQKLKEIQKTISEIHRVLKEKGLLLTNFHSKRSSKYGKGIRVEENTFMQENGPEKGILHHFVDENELRELLRGFNMIDFKVREKLVNGYQRSHFILLAEKSQP
jgi:ubiquinone/menaquinone biosynthesis C-methylase UbiE